MTERSAARLAWSLVVAFAGLAGIGLWLAIVNAHQPVDDAVFVGIFTGMAMVGALVASSQPGNVVGWLYLLFAGNAAIVFFADEYARFGLVSRPGSVPAADWMAFVSESLWVGILTIPFVFIPLVFPDGKLPSRRWRGYAWTAAVFVTFAAVVFALDPHRYLGVENPLGVQAIDPVAAFMEGPGFAVLLALGLTSFASLVLRYRRAAREQRQQIKWVVFGIALLVAWFAVEGTVQVLGLNLPSVVEDVGVAVAFGALPLTAGVAVLRHRLFDIDVVINRTVMFGVLAGAITAVYVGIVVGIGAIVGSRGNLFLSIVATAVIAVGFQPFRERARRLANRLVYGRRATPYEVLSTFADRIAGTFALDDVLPRLARLIADGTGARRVAIWVRVGAELRLEASWPDDTGDWPLSMSDDRSPLAGATRTIPVRQGDDVLGVMAVEMPANEALTPAHEKLLQDVAAQAALVLRNVRLIEELRASRARLVAAQDEERRRIERNIHDGAQQQLVALSVNLKLARTLAARDPEKAQETLDRLQRDAQHALEDLRDLARGIYPPLLADKGLAAALEAQARKAPFPVDVQPNGIGRFPQEIEAAIYFCVLEALQNAAKYADASRALVSLDREDGDLLFEVSDDGLGFDPQRTPRGTGLQNMADRLAALGGSVEVRSAPRQGTTVLGRIPVGVREPVA